MRATSVEKEGLPPWSMVSPEGVGLSAGSSRPLEPPRESTGIRLLRKGVVFIPGKLARACTNEVESFFDIPNLGSKVVVEKGGIEGEVWKWR